MSKATIAENKIRDALIKMRLVKNDEFIVDKLKLENRIGWVLLQEDHDPKWLGFNTEEAINNIETILT